MYDNAIELLKRNNARIEMITPQSIVTTPWTVIKCQYGCAFYKKNLCCPPFAPDYEKTRKIIDCYSKIILFEMADKRNVTHVAVEASRLLFLEGYYKSLAFGSGQCNLCEECALTNCRFPQKAAPSMEACGIDVFQTARNNGFHIETLKNRDEQNHNFGLLLIE